MTNLYLLAHEGGSIKDGMVTRIWFWKMDCPHSISTLLLGATRAVLDRPNSSMYTMPTS